MALLTGGAAQARDFHVSPAGTPGGDGSPAAPLDVFTGLSAKSPAGPGDVIYLAGGVYEGKMNGIERLPFELAVSGAADRPVKVMPAPGESVLLNGTVSIAGSHAWYVGLDIGDLKWDPTQERHKNATGVNVGIQGDSAGVKIVNCNLFGGAMGIGAWSGAVDLEIYGCLIHDFGYVEPGGAGRGHGHAWYTQNERGTKVFAHNVAYRGMGWNVHVYTQQGSVVGFDVIENICYIAGAGKPGQTMDNFLISGYPPADRIRLIGNVGYQPSDVDKWRPNARLTSYTEGAINGSAVVRDNYLIGAPIGLMVGRWKDITVAGNTLWAYDTLFDLAPAPAEAAGGGYKVDGNTYLDNGKPTPFKLGGQAVGFDAWQAAGFDRAGRVAPSPGGRPEGTKVFLFPNKYQKGRAHIGVFNWAGADRLAVDLSPVLDKGQKYSVYNCLDVRHAISMAKPVVTGTFDGGAVQLPLRKDNLSPEFHAFLVVP